MFFCLHLQLGETIRNALRIVFSSLHCSKVLDVNIEYYTSIYGQSITDSIKTIYLYLWHCLKLQQIKSSTKHGRIPYIIEANSQLTIFRHGMRAKGKSQSNN